MCCYCERNNKFSSTPGNLLVKEVGQHLIAPISALFRFTSRQRMSPLQKQPVAKDFFPLPLNSRIFVNFDTKCLRRKDPPLRLHSKTSSTLSLRGRKARDCPPERPWRLSTSIPGHAQFPSQGRMTSSGPARPSMSRKSMTTTKIASRVPIDSAPWGPRKQRTMRA